MHLTCSCKCIYFLDILYIQKIYKIYLYIFYIYKNILLGGGDIKFQYLIINIGINLHNTLPISHTLWHVLWKFQSEMSIECPCVPHTFNM